MTSKEFVARVRTRFAGGPMDPKEVLLIGRLLFNDLADNAWQCRLADGQRLNDVTDFPAFCRELAAVIEFEEMKPLAPDTSAGRRLRSSGRVIDDTCPRCGHLHQGDRECGEELGGGRICRCEMELAV